MGGLEGVELEYAEILDYAKLSPIKDVSAKTLVAIAARVGSTRLIDNIVLNPTP